MVGVDSETENVMVIYTNKLQKYEENTTQYKLLSTKLGRV